jgi:hypothetical protein
MYFVLYKVYIYFFYNRKSKSKMVTITGNCLKDVPVEKKPNVLSFYSEI